MARKAKPVKKRKPKAKVAPLKIRLRHTAKIPKGKFQCTWCLKYVTGIHTCYANVGK